jgi:hypothetical protein
MYSPVDEACRVGGQEQHRLCHSRREQAVRELAHFAAAMLLVSLTDPRRPRGRGRPARLLERRDDEAWAALQALGERFRRPPPGGSGAREG